MFDETGVPRVFAVPPGADFPQALVDGLLRRQRGRPHESMARVHIVVNTRRMERRIKSLLSATGALLLPRITLINDLDVLPGARPVAPPVSALQRRLELARLIRQLLDQHPDLASADSAFDLADSLAGLIDEMHGEGVEPGDIASLDISDLSGHWARAQQFIAIADIYIRTIEIGPDAEARQRQIATDLIKTWSSNPPSDPILIAGSTGSRGTTSMLMQAVAHLPQGAVILPGFDFDAPPHMWDQLTDALSGEDHPQFRFARLMQSLNIGCNAVLRWCESAVPPAPERSSLVSLALRPAPFTDAWLSEGADQGGIAAATEEMALIEANTPRDEALAIALRLRQAAEDGQNAALITPDRMLTRQVAAALDRWNIVPDDSAGIPLHLSPPGRFLRHVSDLFVVRLRSDAMLTLLKHPLAHSGGNRGDHLRLSRDLELFLRRRGIPYPERDSLVAFQDKSGADPNWIAWLDQWFLNQQLPGPAPLSVWVERLVETAEAISAGADRTGSGELWNQNAGRSATTVVSALREASDAGGPLSAREFSTLLSHILTQDVVRDRDAADGSIMIWGTLEARVQGASLVILGGLNEGSWPEAPAPDPWLNRALRQQAGLLLPDRRIGLSAHDFQQAVNAPEVLLTRSKRSDDAETVPSRWVNRLTNLLAGLTEQGGEDALAAMRERGALWLRRAAALDDADRVTPAIRPSPRPPVAARPRQLSVTEIKRLIRDPYAIYARHVLRLRPLDPLVKTPATPETLT